MHLNQFPQMLVVRSNMLDAIFLPFDDNVDDAEYTSISSYGVLAHSTYSALKILVALSSILGFSELRRTYVRGSVRRESSTGRHASQSLFIPVRLCG